MYSQNIPIRCPSVESEKRAQGSKLNVRGKGLLRKMETKMRKLLISENKLVCLCEERS